MEETIKKPETTRFVVCSTVRGRANRALRAASPAHLRLKQFIFPQQLRLVRNRPVIISEEQLLTNLDELRTKAKLGILEVRTQLGQRLVDLELVATSQTVPEAAIAPPAALLPIVAPVTPVDEMQHVGKDYVPPFEGAEKVGPEIPLEGAAVEGGVPEDEEDYEEPLAIPPAMGGPLHVTETPVTNEGEEEYKERTESKGGPAKNKKKGHR